MLKVSQIFLGAILAGACAIPIKTVTEDKNMIPQPSPNEIQVPIEGEMPSFEGATGWINSKPLTRDDLRGKVVLVEFWTYTCINWLRIQPYVRAWSEKYKENGLVVIGVHTPEFEFEKSTDNVSRAASELRVGYPIAIDSEYRVWRAFSNRYWPALYFVDAQGRIRHHQFGEGEYEQSEKVIQKLLAEAGAVGVKLDLVSVNGTGYEVGANWSDLGSPETYVGYGRTANFASPGGMIPDKQHTYELPAQLKLNNWGVGGDWTVKDSRSILNKANGRVAYVFHARDVHLVMSSSVHGTSVRFRVSVDGLPPGPAHGIDVDDQGNGTISQPRLYQLIRQAKPIADRRFEIEFLDPGVEVFVFTFG